MLLRRCWPLLYLVAALLLAGQPKAAEASTFSETWLQDYARELSTRAYTPAAMARDNTLHSLSYDDYRRIVFDPESAIWRDREKPFQLQLFHPGFLHTTPVGIHLIEEGKARRLAFSTELFNYHDSLVDAENLSAGGYAGFRVHHPINTPERHEEFLVFLGASYFRAVGKDQFYGLSARGLAVNTVGEGDEEFPRFTDFWIERPEAGAGSIVLHALLDSPSVTGAYRFVTTPGDSTRMTVDATLYPRRNLTHVGIAPLTSMFMFDASNRAAVDDYRNAVHDSDGLGIVQADGEVIWRPLANPPRIQVSAFGAEPKLPRGFGLLQRRQAFADFNDDEARYEKRPSLWIEPLNDWGQGRVELLEIPTDVEYHDNIVAYWQPLGGLQAGREYHYRYRMHWGGDAPGGAARGRVVHTAAGRALDSDERLFVIDFSDGGQIAGLTSDPDAVRIRAATSAGDITGTNGTLVEATGHYRVYLRLDPGKAELAELRLTLEVDGDPWGETWLYRWSQ